MTLCDIKCLIRGWLVTERFLVWSRGATVLQLHTWPTHQKIPESYNLLFFSETLNIYLIYWEYWDIGLWIYCNQSQDASQKSTYHYRNPTVSSIESSSTKLQQNWTGGSLTPSFVVNPSSRFCLILLTNTSALCLLLIPVLIYTKLKC